MKVLREYCFEIEDMMIIRLKWQLKEFVTYLSRSTRHPIACYHVGCMLCRCNAVLTTRPAGRPAPGRHVFLEMPSEILTLHNSGRQSLLARIARQATVLHRGNQE